jgi:hypothetical protein
MMNAGMSGDMGGFLQAAQAHAAANPQPAVAPSTPPPTPVAPPPPVAATTMTKDEEASKLREYFEKPENAAEQSQLSDLFQRKQKIKVGIASTKALLRTAKTPEEKQQHQDMLDYLEKGLAATEAQRQAILDSARTTLGFAPSAPTGGGAPAGGATSSGSSGGTGGSMGGGGSSGGGGGGGASLASSPPSTGASIGEASTAVAAASEPPAAKNNFSEINSSNDVGSPPPTAIPSPIANRGSLDIGTVFGSES